MKKKILFIMLSVLIIADLTACSVISEDKVSTTESTVFSTTKTESTTEKGITESETTTRKSESSEITTTTTRPAEQKSSGQTTTKKVTATQNQTTTQKQTVVQSQTTTQKVTTTQKQNVTQKQTTTKKVTTTVAPYWCDEGGTHHSCNVGPIGWVNSYDEAEKKALEYAGQNGDSGNFLVKECHNCGKFTAYVTFD